MDDVEDNVSTGDHLARRVATVARSPAPPIVLAFVARIAAQLLLGYFEHPETWEYDTVARNLVSGNGYIIEHNGTTYQAFTSPAFPLLLVGLYAAFGISPVPVGLLLAMFGSALSWTVFEIGRRVSNSAVVPALAGWLAALHPGLVVYAAKGHALGLDALLAALAVLALLVYRHRRDGRATLGIAPLAGVIALARPTFLPFLVLGLVVLGLRSRPRSAFLSRGLVVLLGIVLITGPWLVRNQLVLGRATMATTNSEVLWRGNNPVATGGALTDDGIAMLDAAPAFKASVWGRPEIEQDDAFRAAAIEYMAADPWRTVRAAAGKLYAFWWFTPRTGMLYPSAWLTVYVAYYVVAVLLALMGIAIVARTRQWWPLFVIGSAFVTVSVSHALVYIEGRHRWELESLLLVFSAIGVVALWSWLVRLAPPRAD